MCQFPVLNDFIPVISLWYLELGPLKLSYMKKALVVLLILAVAGGVFAQINWTGDLRAGIAAVIVDTDDADPAFGNHYFNDAYGARFDIIGTYTNDSATAGFRAYIRGRADGNNNMRLQSGGDDGFYLHLYEAWFKAMDGMITIYGGKLDQGGPFGTGGGIDTSFDIGGGAGAFVNVSPFAGLDIRGGVYPGALNSATNGFADARYTFGARYLVTDVVDVIALYSYMNATVADNKKNNAALGFKVLALRDMGFSTFNLDFAFMDLTMVDDFMTIQLGQNIQYTAGDMVAGIRFLEQLRIFKDDEDPGYVPDLTFTGFVQYLVNGSILPRLDFGFNMGAGMLTSVNFRGNWDGTNKSLFTKDASNFVISPSCQFRFGGSASQWIQIGYSMQMDLTDPKADPGMRNTVYASYRVAF